jgi:hypothetical protein
MGHMTGHGNHRWRRIVHRLQRIGVQRIGVQRIGVQRIGVQRIGVQRIGDPTGDRCGPISVR